MEQAVQIFVAVQSTVIGLSHVVRPRAWVDFFIRLREMGHAGVFVNGFLSLWFGSVIVAFHNVWQGWAMAVTLLGWAQVVKGLVSFVWPAMGMRGLNRVSHDRASEFVIAGVVLLGLAALFWCLVFNVL